MISSKINIRKHIRGSGIKTPRFI